MNVHRNIKLNALGIERIKPFVINDQLMLEALEIQTTKDMEDRLQQMTR